MDEGHNMTPEWGEQAIPEKLYSDYSREPFQKCTACQGNLLEPPRMYEIQKVYRNGEVVFEYAICVECGENLAKEYSSESMEAIQQHIGENYLPSQSWEHCHLCDAQVRPTEFTVSAVCHGEEMIMFCITCVKCMEKIEELLSEETRRVMGDFIQDKFPGVPAELSPTPVVKV